MTDLVTPGEIDAEIDNYSMGSAIQKSGIVGWIVDGYDLSEFHPELDEDGVDSFNVSTTGTSSVSLKGGEAFYHGWICRDRETQIDLNPGEVNEIYLGYDAAAVLGDNDAPTDSENVRIGLESEFNGRDPRVLIFEIDVDSDGEYSSSDITDHRITDQPFSVDDGMISTGGSDFYVGGELTVDERISVNRVWSTGTIESMGPVQTYDSPFRQYNDDTGDDNEAIQEFVSYNGDPAYQIGHIGGTGFTDHSLLIGRNSSEGKVNTVLGFGDVSIPNGDLTIGEDDDPAMKKTKSWDGESIEFEAGGDTVEFVRD